MYKGTDIQCDDHFFVFLAFRMLYKSTKNGVRKSEKSEKIEVKSEYYNYGQWSSKECAFKTLGAHNLYSSKLVIILSEILYFIAHL